MSDELDLEPFGRIVERLGEAVAALATDPSNEFKRDSTIKRFELAYELSRNTLRKFLLMDSVSPACRNRSKLRRHDPHGQSGRAFDG